MVEPAWVYLGQLKVYFPLLAKVLKTFIPPLRP